MTPHVRRILPIVAAIVGLALTFGAVVAGYAAYRAREPLAAGYTVQDGDGNQVPAERQTAYRAVAAFWPWGLPSGVRFPDVIPSGYPKPEAFVALYARCSWESAYVDGGAPQRRQAVASLAAIDALSSEVTGFTVRADFRYGVVGAARSGDGGPLRDDLASAPCRAYRDHRASAPHGLTVVTRYPHVAPSVVAHAALTGPGGSGTLTISEQDGVYTASMQGIDLPGGVDAELVLAETRPALCSMQNVWLSQNLLGSADGEDPWQLPHREQRDNGPAWVDPSNWRAVQVGSTGTAGGCSFAALASGDLVWEDAPMDAPSTAIDRGSRYGARSTGIETTVGGHLRSYTVVANDSTAAVAARFGLSPAALAWRNPTDARMQRGDALLVGQRINLEPLER